MFEWIRNDKHARNRQEVAALDERELNDIGVTREALEYLIEVDPAVYGRMNRMAVLHGLTPRDLQVDRADFTHLAHTCDHCSAKRRCDQTLGKEETSVADTGFCPNHGAYEAMANR